MIVWLWDADGPARSGRGVSDDEGRARKAAEAWLRGGHAEGARLEQARAVPGYETMDSGYQRTGFGWQAKRGPRGGISWEPLTAAGAW